MELLVGEAGDLGAHVVSDGPVAMAVEDGRVTRVKGRLARFFHLKQNKKVKQTKILILSTNNLSYEDVAATVSGDFRAVSHDESPALHWEVEGPEEGLVFLQLLVGQGVGEGAQPADRVSAAVEKLKEGGAFERIAGQMETKIDQDGKI